MFAKLPALILCLSVAQVSIAATAKPALNGLSCSTASIYGSGTVTCTVSLTVAAGSGGFKVSLTSSSNAMSVPGSVTVPAGAISASFAATVAAVTTTQTAKLTASASGVTKTFSLQLNPGIPQLSINASSISFGDVALNTPTTQSVTLTSAGSAAVNVSSAVVIGPGFTLSGPALPLTLNPNQAAILNVIFDPAADGPVTGQVTITSNSSTNSTAIVTLAGSGTGIPYEVDLSWEAPTSTKDPAVGYVVYRAPSGTTLYQLLNTSLVTQTAYADSTVQSSKSYDYVVESVDSIGWQSLPSNIFTVTIP